MAHQLMTTASARRRAACTTCGHAAVDAYTVAICTSATAFASAEATQGTTAAVVVLERILRSRKTVVLRSTVVIPDAVGGSANAVVRWSKGTVELGKKLAAAIASAATAAKSVS